MARLFSDHPSGYLRVVYITGVPKGETIQESMADRIWEYPVLAILVYDQKTVLRGDDRAFGRPETP